MVEKTALSINQRPRFLLVVLWPVSIVLGAELFAFISAVPIGFTDTSSALFFFSMSTLFGAIGGLVAGVVIGSVQRMLLPSWVPWSKRWVRATLLGWVLIGSMVWLLFGTVYLASDKQGLPSEIGGVAFIAGVVALAGIVVAIIQVLFMQPLARSASLVWLGASIKGWLVGAAVWAALTYLIFFVGIKHEVANYLVLPVSGGIAGAITGAVMNNLVSAFGMELRSSENREPTP